MGLMLTGLLTRLTLLADDAGAAEAPNPLLAMGWIVPVIVLFYVMIFWPQRREQKRQADMIDNLKKDDEVVLRSGIFGKVVSVSKEAGKVVIKVDENARLTVHQESIGQVIVPETDESKKAESKKK